MSHEIINEMFTSPDLLADLDAKTGVERDEKRLETFENPIRSKDSQSLHSAISIQSLELANSVEKRTTPPDMWSWSYIGLYCQYASVGLLYGASGTLFPLCVYEFEGASNVCSNAKNLVFFAWNLKIFFAIFTDSYRPFGLRRKPYMIAGWIGVLILLLVLAITASSLSVSAWLSLLLLVQAFAMLSDVPADGYCVELGQLESYEQRGQILATGQRIRFTFSVIAGVIQTFLLNGPTTNEEGCKIAFSECWSWGLTANGYYGLLFGIVFCLSIPIFWLKEIDVSHTPQHSVGYFFNELWDTLQNLTTLYLLLFVLGVQSLTAFTYNTNTYLQYYVIKLTNFEAGIDTITTYLALVVAIYIFQTYLIRRNWQYTQYAATIFAAALEMLWIPAYYNSGGTQNPWYTIFIDLDTNFASGLTQVLFSMSVIELSKPGQEATTYELIITVGNAALLVNGIISTQLLTPLGAVGCTEEPCASHTVNIENQDSFNASNGPFIFTIYGITLTCISVAASLTFTRFLPSSKEVCQEWKAYGEKLGNSQMRGYFAISLCVITVLYGLIAAVLLLNTSTSCLPEVGGEGC